MTDSLTQNIITNFNINQMPNTNLSDYKIFDASGTDFSNVMANAANAKAQNTQTNFVDKAAKTNTSSINKKALEKEEQTTDTPKENNQINQNEEKIKEDKKPTLKEKFQNEKLKEDKTNNQAEETSEDSLNDSYSIDKKPVQNSEITDNKTQKEKPKKEILNKEDKILNLNDIDYSSFVDPSPVFSLDETTNTKDVVDIAFSSDEIANLSNNTTNDAAQKQNTAQEDVLLTDIVDGIDYIVEDISNPKNDSNLSKESKNNILQALKNLKSELENIGSSSKSSEFENILNSKDESLKLSENIELINSTDETVKLSSEAIETLNKLIKNNKLDSETSNAILKLLNSKDASEITDNSLLKTDLNKQVLNNSDTSPSKELNTVNNSEKGSMEILNTEVETTQEFKNYTKEAQTDSIKINKNKTAADAQVSYETGSVDAKNKTDNKTQEKNITTLKEDISEILPEDSEISIESTDIETKDIQKSEPEAKNSSFLKDSGALSVSDEIIKLNLEETGTISSNTQNTNIIYDSASNNGIMISNMNNLKNIQLNNIQTPQSTDIFSKNLESSDILNQITDKISDIQNSESKKLTVVLRPYDLGRLHIELITNKDGLTTNILAQNDDVRNYIEKNINTLRQQLHDAGINVNNIQIKTSGQEGSTRYDGNFNTQNEQNNQNLNQQNNNQNQNNGQNKAYESEYQMFATKLNYDFNFVNDFSSVLSKTLSYGLN